MNKPMWNIIKTFAVTKLHSPEGGKFVEFLIKLQ